jgi:hypothetical protein
MTTVGELAIQLLVGCRKPKDLKSHTLSGLTVLWDSDGKHPK